MSDETPAEVGQKAPLFTLSAYPPGEVSLESLVGQKNVVLYFYPKDGTPGCTREACGFRDLAREFEKADTVVLGVSLDPVESHEKFALDNRVPFPLLSDADAAVSKTYGVYREKSLYGKPYWGIERTTFVIDKRGIIRRVWRRVKVEMHAREILGFIRSEIT